MSEMPVTPGSIMTCYTRPAHFCENQHISLVQLVTLQKLHAWATSITEYTK